MRDRAILFMDFVVAAVVAATFVTVEFDLATVLFFFWFVCLFLSLRRSARNKNYRMIAGRFGVHLTVMVLVTTAAVLAPGKHIQQVLHRPVRLKKSTMRLSELEDYCNHHSRHRGGQQFPLRVYIVRNDNAPDQLIHFPSDQLTLEEFIDAIESQTQMSHSFAGCGNAYTILKGRAYNFGLSITE